MDKVLTEKIDSRVLWIEDLLKRSLNDFERRAVVLLCESMGCGPYDFYRTFEKADWSYGRGIRFVLGHPRLATFDASGLTTLVIGAHEQCIRVEILPVNFSNLAVLMWPRERDGSLSRRHPTIEAAIKTYRDRSPTV